MKKINQIKKLKTKYLVTFDLDEPIEVEPVIYIKYHLKLFQNFEQKDYQTFINDNLYEKYKRVALNRLKRMRTKKEVYDHLIEKEAPIGIAKQVIHEFSEKRYLDDYIYTKMYVSLHQNQKGPKYIENELLKKGVDINIIKGFTERINQYEVLNDLMAKKIRLSSDKKSKQQIKMKLKSDFLRLGFSKETIDQVLSKQQHDIPEVDIKVIEKTYLQLVKKIKSHNLSYEDKQKITLKLYRKGYPMDLIKEVINKHT